MRMDKLTRKLQMALADARSLAVGRDHQLIEPIHLVTTSTKGGGTERPLPARAGVNAQAPPGFGVSKSKSLSKSDFSLINFDFDFDGRWADNPHARYNNYSIRQTP